MSTKIGTLTIDMILKTGNFQKGMNDSKKVSRSTMTQMEKDATKYGKVVGATMAAAAAATVAAVGAMTNSYIDHATEVQRFAQISGSTTTEFQRQAAGAKALGIEGDKLADIYKNVNEKLGDFANEGAGGAALFFDEIAPKVGVTIDQFQRLSGPEGLQLYKDSLDQAGVSEKQQISYLEQLSSDSSQLIPLLANGGRGFDAFGDSVAASGAIMSDEGIEKARQMAVMQIQLKDQITGVRNTIVETALPALVDIGTEFQNNIESGGSLAGVTTVLDGTIRGLGAAAIGTAGALKAMWLAAQLGNEKRKALGMFGGGASPTGLGMFAMLLNRDSEKAKAAATKSEEILEKINKLDKEITQSMANILSGTSDLSKRTEEMQNVLGGTTYDYTGGDNENTKQLAERLKELEQQRKRLEAEAKAAQRAIESERAARKSAFDQFVAEQRTEQQIAHETFIERTALINEFTVHGSEQYSRLAFAASHEMSAATASIQAELMRQELDLEEYKLSEIEIIKRRYEIERQEILANAKLTADQRAAHLSANADQMGMAIGQAEVTYRDSYGAMNARMNGTEDLFRLDQGKRDDLLIAEKARDNGIIAEQEYADKRLEIERNYQQQKNALALSGGQAYLGSVSSVLGLVAGEQSAAYRGMFAVQKAVDFASAQMSSFSAIAKAWASAPFPANLPAVALTTVQTGVIPAAIQAITPTGFQSGGYTGNGGVSEIAGVVHGKEWVSDAPTTAKYMPQLQAMSNGTYKEGGGYKVIINNNSSAVKVSASRGSDGAPMIAIDDVDRRIDARAGLAVARDLKSPSSPVSRAMGKHTTAKPALA